MKSETMLKEKEKYIRYTTERKQIIEELKKLGMTEDELKEAHEVFKFISCGCATTIMQLYRTLLDKISNS